MIIFMHRCKECADIKKEPVFAQCSFLCKGEEKKRNTTSGY